MLVVGRYQVEAEEHEDTHERLAVRSVALEADVDALAAQLIFGELEQRDEAVARTLGQDARRNIDVKGAIDEQGLPLDLLLLAQRTLEAEQERVWVVGYFIKVNEFGWLLINSIFIE